MGCDCNCADGKTVVLDGDMDLMNPLCGESGFVMVVHEGDDYELLKNKPSINGVELIGDKTSEDLGIQPGGGEWGKITGDIDTQEDLQLELSAIPKAATVQEVEAILYLP